MSEYKYIKLLQRYSDKPQRDEVPANFKQALLLSKGATNNIYAYAASQTGMPAETIVEYFSNVTDDAASSTPTPVIVTETHSKRGRAYRRKIEKALKRLVNVFDTIEGKRVVELFGDKSVELLGAKNSKILVRPGDAHYAFNTVLSSSPDVDWQIKREYDCSVVAIQPITDATISTLAALSNANVKKLNNKGVNVEQMLRHIDKFADNKAFLKDFKAALTYDISSFANIPEDMLHKAKMMSTELDAHSTTYNEAALEPYSVILASTAGRYDRNYGVGKEYQFNQLLMNGLYTAMNELGVGIFPNRTYARNSSCRAARFNKIAKKVIKLNEQYQKSINSKKNTIEPATIRHTIVGMFNEYSSRMDLYMTMFEREDRPAPTLAEMKPQKQKKVAKTTTTTAKKVKSSTPTAPVMEKIVINGVEIEVEAIQKKGGK